MESAAETERKRYPGIAANGSAIGHLRAREQPNEGRLADAVGAEDAEIMAGRERDRRIFQDDLAPAGGRIRLRHPVEGDHSGTQGAITAAR